MCRRRRACTRPRYAGKLCAAMNDQRVRRRMAGQVADGLTVLYVSKLFDLSCSASLAIQVGTVRHDMQPSAASCPGHHVL